MEIPFCFAVPPDASTLRVPERGISGYMGYHLIPQPPYVKVPEWSEHCPPGWIILHDVTPPQEAHIHDAVACLETLVKNHLGVYLDFELPPSPTAQEFIWQLDCRLHRLGKQCIVPEAYIPATAYALASIPARLTGGSLKQRLLEASAHYDNGICVELIRGAIELPLPCLHNQQTLYSTEDALEKMRAGHYPLHYSSDFCCEYFFILEKDWAKVVLIDTPNTLWEKYNLASQCGATLCIGLLTELGEDFLFQNKRSR